MNTIYHIAMLLLGYFALYSAHRAGLAHLEYKSQEKLNSQPISHIASTNIWIAMITWLGISLVSLILAFKIAP